MNIHTVHMESDLPRWLPRRDLTLFLHESLKPYEDSIPDIENALDYAFSDAEGKGGFLVLGEENGELIAAVVMLNTGMRGYVPEHILLFVGVKPGMRGNGLGRTIIRTALDNCPGAVKLHVEYDNPARRLYERLGFASKYAEMRWIR